MTAGRHPLSKQKERDMDAETNAGAELVEQPAQPEEPKQPEKPKGHQRAGITTNKGHGQGKTRRQMAAKSRRINRRK